MALGNNLVSSGAPGITAPHNPHAPESIASAFAQYEAAKAGKLPPPPPNPVSGTPEVVDPRRQAPPAVQQVAPQGGNLPAPQPGTGSNPVPGALSEVPEGAPADQHMTTLSEVAASFAGEDGNPLDVAGIGHITHEIRGQAVPLSDIIAGYEAMPDAQQVMAQRGFLEGEYAQRTQQLDADFAASVDALSGMTAKMKTRIGAQESPAALAELLAKDPAAYQARITEIDHDKLLMRQADETRAVETKKRGDQQQETTRRYTEAQNRNLALNFPEWNDPKIGPEIKRELEAYATGMGFTLEELAGISDSRMLMVIRDAAMGGKVKAKGQQVIRDAKERKLAAPRDPQGSRGELSTKKSEGNARRAASFKQLTEDHSLESAAAVFGSLVQ